MIREVVEAVGFAKKSDDVREAEFRLANRRTCLRTIERARLLRMNLAALLLARVARESVDEGERLWRFAEVLAHATRVFGSQVEAEQWRHASDRFWRVWPVTSADQSVEIVSQASRIACRLGQQLRQRQRFLVLT